MILIGESMTNDDSRFFLWTGNRIMGTANIGYGPKVKGVFALVKVTTTRGRERKAKQKEV